MRQKIVLKPLQKHFCCGWWLTILLTIAFYAEGRNRKRFPPYPHIMNAAINSGILSPPPACLKNGCNYLNHFRGVYLRSDGYFSFTAAKPYTRTPPQGNAAGACMSVSKLPPRAVPPPPRLTPRATARAAPPFQSIGLHRLFIFPHVWKIPPPRFWLDFTIAKRYNYRRWRKSPAQQDIAF